MQQTFNTRDGRQLTLRTVRTEDAGLLQDFFAGLSAASRRCRFHGAVNGISAAYARRLSQLDAQREMAFVAMTADAQVVAEARYSVTGHGSAEFAIAVGDGWAGLGLARRLMALLIASARSAGLRTLHGDVLADNARMLDLMQASGFALCAHPHDAALLRAEFDLSTPAESSGGWWAALAFLLPLGGAFFQAA
jgi:acetyltransferase